MKLQPFFILNVVFVVFLLVFFELSSAIFFNQEKEEPALPVPELIEYHGYPSEIHEVQTEDGYILEIHRIPHEKKCLNISSSKPREVTLLVHCLLCTSSIWVMQGPAKSLGFLLADGGYDVWMMNSRGTTHSKKHVNLTTESKRYWRFSWHEMAIYDIPATIDYILNSTDQKQLNYVGYSMGTTQFFALMSYKPEYNSKIRKMFALAPAVYLSHSHGILLYMSAFVSHIEKVALAIQQYEFPPNSQNLRESVHRLCDYRNIFLRPSCAKFFILLTGTSNKHLDLENLHKYFMYFPDTTSVKTVTHFYQMRNSEFGYRCIWLFYKKVYKEKIKLGYFCKLIGLRESPSCRKFRPYNYGKKMNQKVYGSNYPPNYNLSQVTAPVHLFYGDGDIVTAPKDVEHLKSELSNVVLYFKVKAIEFSHVDFGWGSNVKPLVYDYILKILNQSRKGMEEETEKKEEERTWEDSANASDYTSTPNYGN